MVIASALETVAAPIPDCFIALSYFDLFAQSLGVGTLWCGLAKWALCDLLPEMRKRLGIPQRSCIRLRHALRQTGGEIYANRAQRGPANVVRVKW